MSYRPRQDEKPIGTLLMTARTRYQIGCNLSPRWAEVAGGVGRRALQCRMGRSPCTGRVCLVVLAAIGRAAVALLAGPPAATLPAALAVDANPSTSLDAKADSVKTFDLRQRPGTNQVSIDSKSTLGDFTSLCSEVTGQFQLDPRRLEGLAGRASMPVNGLHTGIKLRDKHLRGPDWFDAARYPDIVVAISRAEDVHRQSGNSATMMLVGQCTMHGVTRDIRVPATLVYVDETPETARQVPGDLVSIRSEFEFRLSDYNIKGSKMLGLKVQDIQHVRVAVVASSRP